MSCAINLHVLIESCPKKTKYICSFYLQIERVHVDKCIRKKDLLMKEDPKFLEEPRELALSKHCYQTLAGWSIKGLSVVWLADAISFRVAFLFLFSDRMPDFVRFYLRLIWVGNKIANIKKKKIKRGREKGGKREGHVTWMEYYWVIFRLHQRNERSAFKSAKLFSILERVFPLCLFRYRVRGVAERKLKLTIVWELWNADEFLFERFRADVIKSLINSSPSPFQLLLLSNFFLNSINSCIHSSNSILFLIYCHSTDILKGY